MHVSAKKFGKKFLDTYLSNKSNLKVLDFGSYSVNGDLRDFYSKNHEYIGVDIEKGPNVDVLMKDPYKIPFENETIDVVISTSTFEHSEMFWLSFNEIMRVLKPNGLFYMNAPSNGPYHAWPFDCYRFYPDSGRALIKWSNYSGYKNAIMIETFTAKQDQGLFNDCVTIFLKDKRYLNEYPNKMITNEGENYYNGKIYGSNEIFNMSIKTEDQIYKHFKYTSKTEYLFYRAFNKFLRFIVKLIKLDFKK